MTEQEKQKIKNKILVETLKDLSLIFLIFISLFFILIL